MLRSIRRIVPLAMLQLQRRHLRQSQSRQRTEGRSRTTADDLQLTCPYRATSLHQLPAQAQMLKARREENLQRCMGVVAMKSDWIRIAAEGAAALSMEAAAAVAAALAMEAAAETAMPQPRATPLPRFRTMGLATMSSSSAHPRLRLADHGRALLVSPAWPDAWPPAASAFLSRGNVTALHLRRAAEGAAETSEAVATAESEVAFHLRRPAEDAAERQQATSEATATAESGTARQLRRAAVGAAERQQATSEATATAESGTARQLRRAADGGAALRRSTMLHPPRKVGGALQLRQPRRSRTAADGGAALQLQRQQS